MVERKRSYKEDLVPSVHKENNTSTSVFEDGNESLTALLTSQAADDEFAACADVEVSVPVGAENAVDLRRERERAKNRRYAAAYRARCKVQKKELEDRLVDVKARLDDAKGRWRQSRQCNKTLQQRLEFSTSPSSSAPEHVPATEPDQGATPCRCPLHKPADSGRLNSKQCVGELPSHQQQADQARVVLKPANQSIWGILRQHPHSQARQWDTPQSISSAKSFAPISFALLSRYMLPREFWTTCHSSGVLQAIIDYQHSVCAALCLQPQEICWFCQYPCQDFSLSFSIGVRSPECSLSTSLYMVATRVESLCLVVEHELVSAALDPAYVAPSHPTLDLPDGRSSSPTSALSAPSPPDPRLLNAFQVRCGINETAPLAEGVARVLQPLLRSYRARLPRTSWRSICIQLINVLKTSLDPLPKDLPKCSPSDSQSQMHATHMGSKRQHGHEHRDAGNGHCMSSGGMQWEDLDTALHTMQQQVLCTVHSLLAEVDPQEGARMEVRSLQAVQDRMHEVSTTVGIVQNVCLRVSPVIARRFFVRQFLNELGSHDARTAQVAQLHSKLYKQLQLVPTQRAALAELWHRWCARSKALDLKQHDKLCRLSGLLSFVAQPAQVKSLTALADRVEQAVLGTGTRLPPINSSSTSCCTCNATSSGCAYDHDGLKNSGTACAQCCQLQMHTSHGLSLPAASNKPKHDSAGCNHRLQSTQGSHQHGCRLSCADCEGSSPAGKAVFQLVRCTGSMVIDPRWPHAFETLDTGSPSASNSMDECHSCTELLHSGVQPDHAHPAHNQEGSTHICRAQTHAAADPCITCHHRNHESAEVPVMSPAAGANTEPDEGSPCHTEACWCHDSFNNNCTHTQLMVPAYVMASLVAACSCCSSTRCFRRFQYEHKRPEQHASSYCRPSMQRGLENGSSRSSCSTQEYKGCGCDESCCCSAVQAPIFLGMGGGLEEAVMDAFEGLKEVHMSDGFRHSEFLAPYVELDEAQNCLLISSKIDLGLPPPDIMRLYCTAAEEQRRDELFGCFRAL